MKNAASALLFFMLAFTTVAQASNGGARRISILHNMGNRKEVSVLIREGSQWRCESEVKPKLKIKGEPASLAPLAEVEKATESLTSQGCKEEVNLSDSANGDDVIRGCSTNAKMRDLLDAVAKDCAR